jgi:hypothetical protein
MKRARPQTAFKPGHPKLGGRVKGQPNHATVEVREWARAVLQDPQVKARTLTLARAGRLPPAITIELFNRAYGKPRESTDLTVRVPRMVRIIPPLEAAR